MHLFCYQNQFAISNLHFNYYTSTTLGLISNQKYIDQAKLDIGKIIYY